MHIGSECRWVKANVWCCDLVLSSTAPPSASPCSMGTVYTNWMSARRSSNGGGGGSINAVPWFGLSEVRLLCVPFTCNRFRLQNQWFAAVGCITALWNVPHNLTGVCFFLSHSLVMPNLTDSWDYAFELCFLKKIKNGWKSKILSQWDSCFWIHSDSRMKLLIHLFKQ